jgi:hypothetical protein
MRFFGAVGYASDVESVPGVWTEGVTEHNYYGDVIQYSRSLEPASQNPPTTSNNIAMRNSFSIVGDEQAFGNIQQMRYVVWQGSRWTITNVEVRRPRLILTIGEQWDGNTP